MMPADSVDRLLEPVQTRFYTAGMLATYTADDLARICADEIGDELELGRIVHFPECPIALPDEQQLVFLRDELPDLLKLKNISYHPETDRVSGLKSRPEQARRAREILLEHSRRVEAFLQKIMPALTGNWTVGTSSFRPIQEKGRDLSPHASNELVHVDAGAYGATNGDRILRFFVNINPVEDRVWATKGTFSDLYARYGAAAGVTPELRKHRSLDKRTVDHMRSGLLRVLAASGLPQAVLLDSSPYDRTMRMFHNFMKDTPEFQQDMTTHSVMHFKPFSAWMVLTDGVSHASVSGQHALVNTFLLPLANCRRQEVAPRTVLMAA
jgi:hypothetical protein